MLSDSASSLLAARAPAVELTSHDATLRTMTRLARRALRATAAIFVDMSASPRCVAWCGEPDPGWQEAPDWLVRLANTTLSSQQPLRVDDLQQGDASLLSGAGWVRACLSAPLVTAEGGVVGALVV